MNAEDLRRHNEKLMRSEILQDNKAHFSNRYDEAIYSYLRKRINEVALALEKHERQAMITR